MAHHFIGLRPEPGAAGAGPHPASAGAAATALRESPAPPLRIGLLVPEFPVLPNDYGGIASNYLTLAKALTDLGHFVCVIYVTARTDLPTTGLPTSAIQNLEIVRVHLPRIILRLIGARWTQLRLAQKLMCIWRANFALHQTVRRRRLQIVETVGFSSLPLLYLLRRRRVPVVTRVVTTDRQQLEATAMTSRALRLLATAESRVMRRSDSLITHTQEHRDNVCKMEHFSPARFAIIPLGIGPPKARTAADDRPHDRLLFLYVGPFDHRKGTDVLFEAIPAVLKACPALDFLIAGHQHQSSLWVEFSRRHGATIGSRVECRGPVSGEELAHLYQRCDAVVAPSRYESFGLIYVEAMSYGKPVVGCRCGGVPEVVADGVTGLLAEPGNVADLAEKLITLARDSALRARLGNAGRLDYAARFSSVRMAELSVRHYRHVLLADQSFSG